MSAHRFPKSDKLMVRLVFFVFLPHFKVGTWSRKADSVDESSRISAGWNAVQWRSDES